MNTTNLFVELLVIGAGAALALVALAALFADPLVVLAVIFGLEVPGLLALLPLVYVLGILTDRAADKLFENWLLEGWETQVWEECHRNEVMDPTEPGGDPLPLDDHDKETAKAIYYERRRTLMGAGPELFEKLEYTRSRMRICRGWAPSAACLAILSLALAVRWWAESGGWFLGAAALFALLAYSCWAFTRDFQRTYVRKVHRQGKWLAEQAVQEGAQGTS